MTSVFGLYGHIQANRRKSLALVAGLALLVNGLAFGLVLLARAMAAEDEGFAELIAASWGDLAWTVPAATAVTATWVLLGLLAGGAIVDAVTGARGLDRGDDPRLYGLLENLCISRGMAVPRLKILETDALNAFASGLRADGVGITVTRGLLDALDDRELEAVLAHELTHIRNDDVRLMMTAVIVVGLVSFVGELVFRNVRAPASSGPSSERKKGGAVAAILVALAVIGVAWLLSQVVRFSLSRSREFLADAGAVELTKNPDALISALTKIAGRGELPGVPSGIMEMCVDNPASGFADLFASHPPIEDRIEALVRHAGGRRPVAALLPGEPPPLAASPWTPAAPPPPAGAPPRGGGGGGGGGALRQRIPASLRLGPTSPTTLMLRCEAGG